MSSAAQHGCCVGGCGRQLVVFGVGSYLGDSDDGVSHHLDVLALQRDVVYARGLAAEVAGEKQRQAVHALELAQSAISV